MTLLARLAFLADRTIVLFMGVGVGAAIALAFMGGGTIAPARPARVPADPPPLAAPPRSVQAASVAATPAPVTPDSSAQDCALPFPVRLSQRLQAGKPITVGVFGDSFGDGIWAALYRRLAKDNVKVLRLSQEGTGFTRYQTVNLERQAETQLKAEPVDVAVIIIGANDTEGLFDDAHEHAYALMSPGWKAIYGARIERFVNLIRAQGAMVYWVGLPIMRKPGYDHDIAALQAFQAARMAALGAPFISTRDLSADGQGRFNLYLDDPATKAPKLMRANDGIHMTMAGYERLAGPLIDRIHAYLARAGAVGRP